MMMKYPGLAFVLIFHLCPLCTFALREVRVEFDEEDRLVLLVNDTSTPNKEIETATSSSSPGSSRVRQRQLRRDEGISLESSVARVSNNKNGMNSWWSRQAGSFISYLAGDSSWNRPIRSTTTQQQQQSTTRSANADVYYHVPPPPPVQQQRTSYQQFHSPQQQHHYQQYYTPPQQQQQYYSRPLQQHQQQQYFKPASAGFQSAPQQRNPYRAPPQQQQQQLIAHGQARGPDPQYSGGITLSRVVSDTATLEGTAASYKQHRFQYMNPDYPMCWPRGDHPLDLYQTDTCCFLCRSGHNPTKPTRGVVVGANVHMEFTGTCTGLHEHMRNTKLTMGDTMCKITQTTFADYCCAGELELSTNMGTWTVK